MYRRLIQCILAVIVIAVGCLERVHGQPCTIRDIQPEYPVKLLGPMADWRAQDYQDSQGITAVRNDSDQECLVLDCDLRGQHVSLSKGEIVLDLLYVPTLEVNAPVDMTSQVIEVDIEIPPGFSGPAYAPSGAQVFVKDTAFRSQYGTWVNCTTGRITVSLHPSNINPPGGWTDAGFNPADIRTVGIKLAMNVSSSHQYEGQVRISRIEVIPSLPFSAPPNLPPDGPLPFVEGDAPVVMKPDGFYLNCRKWLIAGGNWRVLEYGQNFGVTAWFPKGNGVSKHPGYIAAKLDLFRQAGISLVRVGLLDDGRAVLDIDCQVTGFDQMFRCDVSTLLHLAAQHEVKVEFTLVDFMLAGKAENVDGVWVRGRRNLIENESVRSQFLENFLVPFLDEFGDHPALFGFDVINEPEWILAKDDGGGWEDANELTRPLPSIQADQFGNFINECIAKIRLHAPGKFVTVGVSCTHVGIVKDFDLNYLAVHYYPYMGDFEQRLAAMPRDKPWLLEEFPGKGDLSSYYQTTCQAGGSGALLWNLSPEIDEECYRFEDEEGKLQEIRNAVLELYATLPGVAGEIEFTYIPPFGSDHDLQGRVSRVNPADYKVAVYIYVGGWWTKPSFASPLTSITTDSTWTCDITAGGSDKSATRISVFLVPNGYNPPLRSGQGSLPSELYQYPYADATRDPVYRTISFGGYNWSVLQSQWPIGAGPNYFTDDPNDVRVDANGLHLSVVYKDPNWYCSEVICNERFAYGTYVFTVQGRTDLLDPNIVLGLFTWDCSTPQCHYREIDIELSKWRDSENDNAQFVVQPWYTPGNMHRFNIDLPGHVHETTTHTFTWQPDRIVFRSYYGDYPLSDPDNLIDSWVFAGGHIPSPGAENPRINFWLLPPKGAPEGTPGGPPADGQDAEIVVKSFRYLPIGDFCGANFTDPDGYVDVWDLMEFADHWHIRTGENNWDPEFDLAGPNFEGPDGYIDVWDLMVFADHWHEGVNP